MVGSLSIKHSLNIPKRQKISSVLWSKIFASHNSGYTMEFYYGVEKGGSVNHLEISGVESFMCNRTKETQLIIGRLMFNDQ